MNRFYDRGSYICGTIITADNNNIHIKQTKIIQPRELILEFIREKDDSKMVLDFLNKIKYYNPDYDDSILWPINDNWKQYPELKSLLLCCKSPNDLASAIEAIEALPNNIEGFEEIRRRYQEYYLFLLLLPFVNFNILESFSISKLEEIKRLCEESKIYSNAKEILLHNQMGKDNESIIELSKRIRIKFNGIRMH